MHKNVEASGVDACTRWAAAAAVVKCTSCCTSTSAEPPATTSQLLLDSNSVLRNGKIVSCKQTASRSAMSLLLLRDPTALKLLGSSFMLLM
jgi:hypothetical protein